MTNKSFFQVDKGVDKKTERGESTKVERLILSQKRQWGINNMQKSHQKWHDSNQITKFWKPLLQGRSYTKGWMRDNKPHPTPKVSLSIKNMSIVQKIFENLLCVPSSHSVPMPSFKKLIAKLIIMILVCVRLKYSLNESQNIFSFYLVCPVLTK